MVVSGVSIVGVNEGDVDPRSVGVNLEGVACFVVSKVWVPSVVDISGSEVDVKFVDLVWWNEVDAALVLKSVDCNLLLFGGNVVLAVEELEVQYAVDFVVIDEMGGM